MSQDKNRFARMPKVIGRVGLLAALAVTAAPALAGEIVSSHDVRLDRVSFVCGEMNEGGKLVRFMRSTPGAKYLPEYEPAAGDPLARSWDIAYRLICEGSSRDPVTFAKMKTQRSVR
jgi:hypothetical protein